MFRTSLVMNSNVEFLQYTVGDTDLGRVCLERASSSSRRLLASSSCVAVCGLGSGGMLGSATKGCAGVGGDAERRRCLPHDDDTLSRSLWVPPPVPLPLAGPLSSSHDNTRLSTDSTSHLSHRQTHSHLSTVSWFYVLKFRKYVSQNWVSFRTWYNLLVFQPESFKIT